jgi:hypothetical protein
LGEIGSNEYLHNSTIDLVYSISNNNSDLRVKKVAKQVINSIKRNLFTDEREQILRRDHYTCLCCGETNKNLLQLITLNQDQLVELILQITYKLFVGNVMVELKVKRLLILVL